MMELKPVKTHMETVVVPETAAGVADALRQIADAIDDHELCLIGLWSTGFAGDGHAAIQVVFDADGYPSITDDVTWSPCDQCGATGYRADRLGRITHCQTCDGTGHTATPCEHCWEGHRPTPDFRWERCPDCYPSVTDEP